MPSTHITQLRNKRRVIQTATAVFPSEPVTGDFFWDASNNAMWVYDTNQWYHANFTTTTSTSTSTTSTSTSTTSTSSSTSSSSSTSTSTSTSTTTTL